MMPFSSKLIAQHAYTAARSMQVDTPHGRFITPVFMPVATRAGVNNMTPRELLAAGSQIILGGNTYHMLCAPQMEVIEQAKGMHAFMGWHGPMLTDSGGFQVFSLSKNKKLCTIDDKGAYFSIPGSSRKITMTPQMSLQTQKIIGADIIMAFDQCTPDSASYDQAKSIMKRTHRWLEQSRTYHQHHPTSRYGHQQALFGIVQGGIYDDLRQESAKFVSGMDLDGVAIGGESIGFDMARTVDVVHNLKPHLPSDKLCYTMGVGLSPQDLLDVVAEGVDMFDCVAPTRNARHGALYSGQLVPHGDWLRFDSEHEQGRIQIKKSCYANDLSPIMPGCDCYTCQRYSRAYLHQLFKQKSAVFTTLACIHNIHVMQHVCTAMRELIHEHPCSD